MSTVILQHLDLQFPVSSFQFLVSPFLLTQSNNHGRLDMC